MKAVSIMTKKYSVMVNDVDFLKKLKLSAAFNLFQEIAGLHSDNLGIGFNTIQKDHGVVWVLIRMRVDMIRYPLWDEEITIETWPQLPKKVEFERDYLMKDSKGEIIGRAISTWVILDLNSHELKKSQTIAIEYPEICKERAIDFKLGKINPSGKSELAYKRVIGCSDIDMNGHLNNSKYIDFIMDCFTMDELKKYHAESLRVNYVNEVFAGDTLVLYKYASPANPRDIIIEGINEKDSFTVFTSEIFIVPN